MADEQTIRTVESAEQAEEPVVLSDVEIASEVGQAEQFGEELIAVQNLIKRYSDQFDEMNDKFKEIRDSLNNLFMNNEELNQLEEEAKVVTNKAKAKKQAVKESPEAIQLQMKAKEIKEEMNEIRQTLNNHLLRYYQMTGSQVIEEEDGTEREFSLQARLKPKHKSE